MTHADLTKGSHVAVQLPAVFEGKGFVTKTAICHVFICTPWRGFYILGPTEQTHESDLNTVMVTDDDIDGMLHQVNALLPNLRVTRTDVRWHYAGGATGDVRTRASSRRLAQALLRPDAARAVAIVERLVGRLVSHADTGNSWCADEEAHWRAGAYRRRAADQSSKPIAGFRSALGHYSGG